MEPTIFVKGFPPEATQDELKRFFQKAGEVRFARIVKNYAFISFSSLRQAQKAVSKFHQKPFYKQRQGLIVEITKSKNFDRKDREYRKVQNDLSRNVGCFICGKQDHRKINCPQFKSRIDGHNSREWKKRIPSKQAKRYERRRKSPSSSRSSSRSSSKRREKSVKNKRKYSRSSSKSYSKSRKHSYSSDSSDYSRSISRSSHTKKDKKKNKGKKEKRNGKKEVKKSKKKEEKKRKLSSSSSKSRSLSVQKKSKKQKNKNYIKKNSHSTYSESSKKQFKVRKFDSKEKDNRKVNQKNEEPIKPKRQKTNSSVASRKNSSRSASP